MKKAIYKKTDLEKRKAETIETCHQWRIDTINIINRAHKLLVQTVDDEYEILRKEYELYIDKEMMYINIDKSGFIKTKEDQFSSLIVPLSFSSTAGATTATPDSTKSLDAIKQCMEALIKHIDRIQNISFQVKFPSLDIYDNLKVESRFGDITRTANVTEKLENYINKTPFAESEVIQKKVNYTKK